MAKAKKAGGAPAKKSSSAKNSKIGDANAKKKAAPADDLPPEVKGSEADYQRFLVDAQQIDARNTKPLRADPSLAYHNAARGVAAVLAHEGRIKQELPAVDIESLRSLPALALGVAFAAEQAAPGPAGPEIRALLSEAAQLRRLHLTTAESLVEAKILPAQEVAKIRAGKGQIDMALDCGALAALFRKHAPAIKGKSAVTAAQTERAAVVGAKLIEVLNPKGASKKRKAGSEEEQKASARDRLWSLLLQRHEDLWRAGAYLFGRDVDERVPSLMARVAPVKSKKKGEAATPPAP